MSVKALKPCPVCGSTPDRFTVGQERIEVIACPNGCMSHPLGFVIHVTSKHLIPSGYTDIADVWNSMEVTKTEDGKFVGGFYLCPKHMIPVDPSGPYNKWSPAISKRKKEEMKEFASEKGGAA